MKTHKTYILYSVTAPSEKVYYGITSQSLEKRKYQHINRAKNGSFYPIHKSINYYKDALIWKIELSGLSREDACLLERQYIADNNSLVPNGYNVSTGGHGSNKEYAIYENHGEINVYSILDRSLIGTWSCVHRISDSLKCEPSLVYRCLVGKTVATNGYLFCRHKDLHLLEEKFARVQSNRKRLFVVSDSQGNKIGEWDNTNQCARDLNLPTPREIRAVLNSPRRSSYKGYSFKFKEGNIQWV